MARFAPIPNLGHRTLIELGAPLQLLIQLQCIRNDSTERMGELMNDEGPEIQWPS